MAADWRTDLVDRIRALVVKAEPGVDEEAKWRKASNPDGVPTFSSSGLVCTVETYKAKVKVTFAKGASLTDQAGLLNPAPDARYPRAVCLREDDADDQGAAGAPVRPGPGGAPP